VVTPVQHASPVYNALWLYFHQFTLQLSPRNHTSSSKPFFLPILYPLLLISHTSKVKCDLFESAYCLIGKTISIQYILAELLQNLNYKEQTANNKKKKNHGGDEQ